MIDCTHRRIVANRCTACGEVVRVDCKPAPTLCCSICGKMADELGPGVRLVLVANGKVRKCSRCQDEHPRAGRYNFAQASRPSKRGNERRGGAE